MENPHRSASAFPKSMRCGRAAFQHRTSTARSGWLGGTTFATADGWCEFPRIAIAQSSIPLESKGFDAVRMQVSATVRYALSDSWLLIKGESTKKIAALACSFPGWRSSWHTAISVIASVERLIARVAPRSRQLRTDGRALGQPKCGDALEPSITSPKLRRR